MHFEMVLEFYDLWSFRGSQTVHMWAKPANKHESWKNKAAKRKKCPPVRDCWTQRDVLLFFQARKRTEICLFPCYFVRGAFIKITNIDFGKAMKRVMTLRRSVARVRARAGGDDQSTRAEIGDFNYLTLPAKFTICRANYILLLELYTQKNKSFCLLSGKDQSDISPSCTPRWKCLFQPPDIYIPALTPLPSILIIWSCQGFGWPGFTAVWRRHFLTSNFIFGKQRQALRRETSLN